MNILETYCAYKFNSIVLSKLLLKNILDLPKITKVSFFFFFHIKNYKKNLLLFYIILSLFFGNLLIIKKKEIQKLYLFKVILNKNKIFIFILNFIAAYLPLINVEENIIKCGILISKKKSKIYRLKYSHFPTISELDKFYLAYEQSQHHVSSYSFQLDFLFFTKCYIKNLLDFLPRMYRFPCFFKYKKLC